MIKTNQQEQYILTNKQKNLLENATQDVLVQHFNSKYNEEDAISFGKMNGLKMDMFHGFLNENEKYVTARFALLKIFAMDTIQWEIKSKDYLKFLYEYSIAKSWLEIKKIVTENATDANRNTIVIIDGDNLSHELSFNKLTKYYEEKDNLLHIIVLFANGVVNDALCNYESKSYISIGHSMTNTKDAADIFIAMLIGSIQSSLQAYCPTICHNFLIVTKDHFYEELCKQLQSVGHRCHPAKSIKDCLNVLGRLSNNEDIITIPEKVANTRQDDILISKIIENPSTDEAREFFELFWLGVGKSQAQFCKTYKIDATNFSKYLNRKKYNHSCKMKLEELYNHNKKSTDEISRFIVNNRGDISHVKINQKIYGNTVEIEIDPKIFSFTTTHEYNPLYKEKHAIIYEEWLSSNGKYMARYLKTNRSNRVIKLEMHDGVVTIPMKMKHDTNTGIPIDLEVRRNPRTKVPEIFLKPTKNGNVNNNAHNYFMISGHWTPQSFLKTNNRICCYATGDLFGSHDINMHNTSELFKPLSIKKSDQIFYPKKQVALEELRSTDELISRLCEFHETDDGIFLLDVRNSIPGDKTNRFILKKSVVEFLKKRSPNEKKIVGVIKSVDFDEISNSYSVVCKII